MTQNLQGEQNFFADIAGGAIYCTYHAPAGQPKRAVLFCSPIHEEKKSVHRPFVDAARALAQRGVAALRFDYRGTGDSPGEPMDVTPATIHEDILAAAEIVRERSGCAELDIVAMRLGATFAALALGELAPRRALLCEPIAQGKRYLARARTRKRVRKMVTAAESGGQARPTSADDEAEGFFDFDGHPIGLEAVRQLDEIDLMASDAPLCAEIVILEIAPREKASAQALALADKFRERGARVANRVIVAPPFWNALDPVSVPEFTEVVLEALLGEGLSEAARAGS